MIIRLRVMSATLVVADVARSNVFYVATLDCVECFRVGDPPDFAAVEREAPVLNLMPAARGCLFEVRPTAFWYGLRDCSLRDPDDNRITFGEQAAPQTSPS